jgi:hypothetical protein
LRELADGRGEADDAPGFGGADRAVGQIELRGGDLGLVERHRALVLCDQEALIVRLLLRDRAALHQKLIAAKILLRLFQQRLVMRQLRLGLIERDPVIAIVDAGDDVAGGDVLIVGYRHGSDVARNLWRHGERTRRDERVVGRLESAGMIPIEVATNDRQSEQRRRQRQSQLAPGGLCGPPMLGLTFVSLQRRASLMRRASAGCRCGAGIRARTNSVPASADKAALPLPADRVQDCCDCMSE